MLINIRESENIPSSHRAQQKGKLFLFSDFNFNLSQSFFCIYCQKQNVLLRFFSTLTQVHYKDLKIPMLWGHILNANIPNLQRFFLLSSFLRNTCKKRKQQKCSSIVIFVGQFKEMLTYLTNEGFNNISLTTGICDQSASQRFHPQNTENRTVHITEPCESYK